MLRINVLGCGSSLGVPVIACCCSVCKSDSPYNKRLRSSIIINDQNTAVLVDFGFDIRNQLISSKIVHLDAAILTHEHADHVTGIDELKIFTYLQKKALKIFVFEKISALIFERYRYLFDNRLLKMCVVSDFQKIKVNNTIVQLFPQNHGEIKTLGVKVKDFVYSCDISSIPAESEKYLYNVKAWVVDCTNYKSSKKHAGLELVFQWYKKYKPQKVYLTNMSHNIDYHKILTQIPKHIVPLYDKFKIKV